MNQESLINTQDIQQTQEHGNVRVLKTKKTSQVSKKSDISCNTDTCEVTWKPARVGKI